MNIIVRSSSSLVRYSAVVPKSLRVLGFFRAISRVLSVLATVFAGSNDGTDLRVRELVQTVTTTDREVTLDVGAVAEV